MTKATSPQPKLPVCHVVQYCPYCRHKVWASRRENLIDDRADDPRARGALAFTAVTKLPNAGRAWKFGRVLRSLPAVRQPAGATPVDELRELARASLDRMLASGLLDRDDLIAALGGAEAPPVTSTRATRPPAARRPPTMQPTTPAPMHTPVPITRRKFRP